jgi:hypothetical protein
MRQNKEKRTTKNQRNKKQEKRYTLQRNAEKRCNTQYEREKERKRKRKMKDRRKNTHTHTPHTSHTTPHHHYQLLLSFVSKYKVTRKLFDSKKQGPQQQNHLSFSISEVCVSPFLDAPHHIFFILLSNRRARQRSSQDSPISLPFSFFLSFLPCSVLYTCRQSKKIHLSLHEISS